MELSAEAESLGNSPRPKSRFGGFRRILNILCLIVVAVGLWQAVQAAIANIYDTQRDLDDQIQAIKSKEAESSDPQAAAALLAQRQKLQQTRDSLWSVRWPWIIVAALSSMLAIVPPACYWFQTLRAFSIHVKMPVIARAYFVGNLGKYVPGKAMVLVLRATALRPYGASLKLTTASVFVETLTTMATGAAIGGLIVQIVDTPLWLRVFGFAVAVGCFLPILPIVFRPVLTYRMSSDDPLRQQLNQKYNLALMAKGVGLSVVNWLLLGTSLYCVVCSFPFAGLADTPVAAQNTSASPALPTLPAASTKLDSPIAFWAVCTAACALSVVAGFVSMLPGGAGVRELVLTILLTPLVGSAGALVVAIVHRLVTIVSEVLMAGIGSLMDWRFTNSVPAASQSVT